MTIRKASAAVAAALGISLVLGACSSPGEGKSEEKQITLSVGTFNDFGYDELYKEYMSLHPNIKIEDKRSSATQDAREALQTRIAAGSGLSDIEAVEGDWMPELLQYPEQWVDLTSPDVEGRWLDWKTAKATVDGKLLAYGTDSAPNALCFRTDVFAAAGLPTDRGEVAKLLEGDWNKFFEVGKRFKAKSKVAWFDSSGSMLQGMISQMPNAFENSDGTPIPLDENKDIKTVYDTIVANLDQSARLKAWEEDWMASFQGEAKYATLACPSWMLGFVEEQAKGVKGWDVANVFPGGGSNSGGSYLMVSAQSEHPEEAKALAAWLTAPEQQVKAFKAKKVFPSQVEALKSPEVTSMTSEFFNNAPVGEILADRAKAIKVHNYTGIHYAAIRDIVGNALSRVEIDGMDPDESWKKAVEEYKALNI